MTSNDRNTLDTETIRNEALELQKRARDMLQVANEHDLAIWCDENNLHVGDRVTSKGRLFEIVSLVYRHRSEPDIFARKVLKSGALHKNKQRLFILFDQIHRQDGTKVISLYEKRRMQSP